MAARPCRLLSWLLLLALGAARADDLLPPPMQDALDRIGVPAEAVHAIAVPLHWWGRTWSHRADVPAQPGSSIKLVTTVVALDRLGPNHRGGTELLSAAPVDGEVLRGELVLRGGGDPELGWSAMWQLLSELHDQGVREIAGDIVLDRTRYRPARLDQGLPPFDEAPEFAYNAIPDALLLTGNLMGLEIAADDAGRVTARTAPRLDGVELVAHMGTVDARCADWDSHWQPATVADDGRTLRIVLNGAFPRGCRVRTFLQLVDRDRLAELTLRTLWSRLGGRWGGTVRAGAAPAGARVLAQRLARPWGEVLRHVNKTSDNALTRLLYLELGAAAAASAAADPRATTRTLAEAEVRSWFAEHAIPADGLVLDNGSGLSRSERISARQLARVIEAALEHRHAPELMMSLPTVGVDGTMRNRLKESPATGWARLKTGTLANVVALAGVVRDDARRPWVMVAMVNHERAGQARPALDALVDWIARGRALPQGYRTDVP